MDRGGLARTQRVLRLEAARPPRPRAGDQLGDRGSAAQAKAASWPRHNGRAGPGAIRNCTKGPQLRDRSAASACSALQAL
eukprot:1616762-Alexandrium_andersonii.AAC.1